MPDGKVTIDIVADGGQAEKELKSIEKKADDTGGELDDMGDKADDASEAVKDLGDSADKAGKDVEDLGDSSENAGKGFGSLDVAVGTFVGNALSSLVSGIADAAGEILGLAESTREYREDMAKLQTAFTSTGHSTDTAAKTYKDFYAILGESDRSVEAVNHLAELTKSEQDLSQWSTIAAGVTAKFGDSLPIEGLTEAANETAKVGAVTGPLADALNWAGVSEDAFNEKLAACTNEQQRASLITSTLNGLYADAAAEYNELTAEAQNARRATAEMEEAEAALGAAMEPVQTAFTQFKTQALQALLPIVQSVVEWLQSVQKWAEENPEKFKTVKNIIIALVAAFGTMAVVVGIVNGVSVAMGILNAVMAMNPIMLIVMAIAGLIAAFIALWNNCDSFRQFWIDLWDGIVAGVKAAWDWIVGIFNSVIDFVKNNWQTLLLFLVNPFAGAFKLLYDNCEGFRNFVDGFVQKVKEFFVNMWNDIVSFFTKGIPNFFKKIGDWIKNLVTTVKDKITEFVTTAVNTIKELPGKIWHWLSETINKVVQWGKDLVAKGKQAAVDLFNNIVNKIKELPKKMLNIGKDIVEGLWNGIKNMGSWIAEKIKSFGDGVLSGIKDFFGINSPSKVMEQEVGVNLVYGVGKGFEKGVPEINQQLDRDLQSVKARAQLAVSAENARMSQGYGVADTGIADLTRAVGTQSAGINSLANEYRKGGVGSQTVVLELDGRELGRAVVKTGNTEVKRMGTKLAFT